ncbi:ABC transporter substrate-binding protein [Saccharibacillus sp. CPCC 101409]|uniref:ABC transporter substrate-binding protein n=1 Tax=Saccharibacillus sp. CPCC 101409 TaxID=3058041 RepID=UPI0026715429|nr:ABC transporter substrate-binding protein [Saccharibacillus sp. CPCC 101409]MDO3410012.1 ABC transporter substrate-binding protein [Saccharibacillus sp. CPCC 101409]
MKNHKTRIGKRPVMLMMLTAAFGAALAGCGGTTDSNAAGTSEGAANAAGKTAETETITLGLLPSIDAIPFIIAHDRGFDKEQGVNLDIQTFKSAKDRDVAFQAGKVEGLSADLVAISIYNEAGQDVKITSTTFGEFDLLTGSEDVKSAADLKGKTVILSKNTSTEYTMAMMLKQAGLTEDDITVTEVPQIPTRLELLKNGKADAAVLPQPFVTMGKADGLNVLGSTHSADVEPFVLAFPQSVIDAKGDAIREMYAAYDEAVEYMKSHDQSEYIDLIIKEVGYPETLKDQIDVPDYVPANQVDPAQVDSALDWAREKGLLTKDIKAADVISDVQFK